MERVSRLNPIFELLRVSPRQINKILIQKERAGRRLGETISLARARGVPVLFVPKIKLDSLAPSHQGAVALVSPQEFVSLEDILDAAAKPFLVLLDEVEDPQNLGAIIRSAEGAGADGVILPERRSAGLTEAVAAASAGALAHMKVARVKNLAQTMDSLKQKGLWLVGAEGGSARLWYEFDYTLPVGLIFGSESKGLRPLIKSKCDAVLSIPLFGRVNSLNVSAAAAIFLFEAARQRLKLASK
jgi:23S rRNA (guanosine2251-2'-O)-methyltransferase